jgi:hypothetical protein
LVLLLDEVIEVIEIVVIIVVGIGQDRPDELLGPGVVGRLLIAFR